MPNQRTFTISLPPTLARQIDKIAKAEGRTRSELFREALRQYIARVDRWERIFQFGEEVGRRFGGSEEDVARIVEKRRRSRS